MGKEMSIGLGQQIIQLSPLSFEERLKIILPGRIVPFYQLEQLIQLSRAWFTHLDGPEPPTQLYHLYLGGLCNMVENGEIEIDWGLPEIK
jgi:hypothetical protein